MAVVVRDLYFSYKNNAKKKTILNGVNIHVPPNTTYALLGPSGCGKTTLLEILIGFRKAKSGKFLLFGYQTNSKESGVPGAGVGYMPQEIALQFNLTVSETMYYFARIQMMNSKEIEHQCKHLIQLFSLPEKNRLIGNLSGGQKRLVSLAIALLHKPRLLILDEPTVGVDPLLRNVIWTYLSSLKSVTTIITTHYINESQRAKTVAFMRKGEILGEGLPSELMNTYNCPSLDGVFIKLCLQQGSRRQPLTTLAEESDSNSECVEKFAFECKTKNFEKFFRVIRSSVTKHLIECRRNCAALCLLFLCSFSTIFVSSMFFGRTPVDLNVAWVNDDLVSKYYDAAHRNKTFGEIDNVYLPSVLKKTLNSEVINLVDCRSLSEAKVSLSQLEIHGIIHVKSNFSIDYLKCDVLLNGDGACVENNTVENSMITLYTDVTNPIITNVLRFTVRVATENFRKEVAKMIGVSVEKIKPQIVLETINNNSVNEIKYNFEKMTASGILVIATFGFSMLLSILSFVEHKESDITIRNYASGLQLYHSIFAELTARTIPLLLSSTINLFFTMYYFEFRFRVTTILAILLLVTQAMLGTTQGILLNLILKKSMLNFITCTALVSATAFTSGVFWSIEAQPKAIQFINYFIPLSHSISAMRTLLLNSEIAFRRHISNAFIASFAWIAFSIVFAIIFSKFRK